MKRLLYGLTTAIVIALMMGVAAPEGRSAAPPAGERAEATFAGGCFWCMEPPFDKIDGVRSTISGYTGGTTKNPTYEQVSAGGTGHAEAVEITYDSDKVSYEQLLEVFWRNIDPFDAGGQFCDRGSSYRSAIFYHSDEQKAAAEASKQRLQEELGRTIVTEIVPAAEFYRAENYHQDYYQTNMLKYKFYRWNCGRDQRLEQVWGSAPSN
jgi:peptide-methionine (S)-S-oxide reductase